MISNDLQRQLQCPRTENDEGCFGMTAERKYYHRGDAFIKRSLRPHEYITGHRGLHVLPGTKNAS